MFEKTEEGWKVVNTDFIDKLDEIEFSDVLRRASLYPTRPHAPNTGNESVFAIVAAAALALAVVIKKKKNEGKR